MNIKRYLLAVVALIAFIYVFEMAVHGVLLAHIYSETPAIWRDYSEMAAYIPYNMVIMSLLAMWITFIFTRLFKDGGWKNGLTFGIYFGILSAIQAAGAYYYLPISAALTFYWFIAYAIESMVGGMIIGAIYRK